MSFDRNYRRTTTATGRGRRPLYAPPPPPSNRRNHSVLGYWVPLVVTGTIAIGGLAAWIWSERREHDDGDFPPDHKPPSRPPTGPAGPFPPPGSAQQPHGGPPPPGGNQPMPPPVGGESASYYTGSSTYQGQQQGVTQDSSFYGQVRGIVRRAPSPEQFFSHASKQVSAGMAAAGAALSSIMEENPSGRPGDRRDGRLRQENREGFSDHERWSEEADEQTRRTGRVEAESERRAELARDDKGKGGVKKTIAIVLSADLNMDGKLDQDDMDYMTEHASILSHLPHRQDTDQADVFVLIYTPGLESLPPVDYKPAIASDGRLSALGSSYSAIDTPVATPGDELQSISPRIDPVQFTSPGPTFDALYLEASSRVSHPSRILPFTTLTGYVPILRHLAPQLVYVSDMLSGDDGDSVAQLKGWVGRTVVVAGDDGTGGLADTETEDEGGHDHNKPKHKWYESSSLVGLGKPIEIVDVDRVGDDWTRRAAGRE